MSEGDRDPLTWDRDLQMRGRRTPLGAYATSATCLCYPRRPCLTALTTLGDERGLAMLATWSNPDGCLPDAPLGLIWSAGT